MFQYFEELILGNSKDIAPFEVKGNFNFKFCPTFKGQPPLNTISIVVACYQNETMEEKIEFSIKWCKIMDNDVYEIRDYHENYYHVNPSDIDLRIRAVVTSKNQKFPGTAILTVGPIMLDGAIKPELEGMVLNKSASFKCAFVSWNEERISPNLSLIHVEKPIMKIVFDPKMVSREGEVNKQKFRDLEFNFEKELDLKVKVDSHNINNIIIQFQAEKNTQSLLAKFDNRMQRDLFYIYLKLMRMLRAKILEDMDTEFEKLIGMSWCFLNTPPATDLYDGLRGYQFIFSSDILRETLKKMVRLNKTLQGENVHYVDSLEILENDLQVSVKEFDALLEDGKIKNTKNLKKFERSHRSIIQESSVIIDGVKTKNKKQQRKNDESIIEATRDIQDELTSVKKINEILKKEIELHKGAPKNPSTGTGSSTAPKMESLDLSAIQVTSSNKESRQQHFNSQKEDNGRYYQEVQSKGEQEDQRNQGR